MLDRVLTNRMLQSTVGRPRLGGKKEKRPHFPLDAAVAQPRRMNPTNPIPFVGALGLAIVATIGFSGWDWPNYCAGSSVSLWIFIAFLPISAAGLVPMYPRRPIFCPCSMLLPHRERRCERDRCDDPPAHLTHPCLVPRACAAVSRK